MEFIWAGLRCFRIALYILFHPWFLVKCRDTEQNLYIVVLQIYFR